MKPKFSMLVRWSNDDGCYVVYVPELNVSCGHGDTYGEAAAHAQEALEGYVEGAAPGEVLPEPLLYGQRHTISPPDEQSGYKPLNQVIRREPFARSAHTTSATPIAAVG